MSWGSTTTYYHEINHRVHQVQGGMHSARCVVFPSTSPRSGNSNMPVRRALERALHHGEGHLQIPATDKFELRVIMPDKEGRATVHSIIYTELRNGIISETPR
ncbi:hypothetical protein DL765_004150 [Monosporascus sp. GIB2]|nr:hypothetical protein DL765_004150 [Monosporascus sp. GIB2]